MQVSGTDFRIKLKTRDVLNQNLFHIVRGLIPEGRGFSLDDSQQGKKDLNHLISNIVYKKIDGSKTRRLSQDIENDTCVVYLSISTCFKCPESHTIDMLKQFAERKRLGKNQIILMFGKGNDLGLVRQFAQDRKLDKTFTVGVIQQLETSHQEAYWDIFRLDLDPRVFVINKAGIAFIEEKRGEVDFNSIERFF
jgi:hypothetical protein